MTLHHLGIAVVELIDSIQSYKSLGWTRNGEIVEDREHNIKLAFLKHNYSSEMLELICPTNDKSPISNTLMSMKNVATPYHICYEVNDIDKVIHILKGRNYILTLELKPKVAFENRHLAFMLRRDLGLVEILEKEKSEP